MKIIKINDVTFHLVNVNTFANFWVEDAVNPENSGYYYCPELPPYTQGLWDRDELVIVDDNYGNRIVYRGLMLLKFLSSDKFLHNYSKCCQDTFNLYDFEGKKLIASEQTLEQIEAIMQQHSTYRFLIDFA